MVPSKFGVNWPFGSGEEAKNRFSRWQPWRPSWISDRNGFSYFWSTSHPDASYQVSSQMAQGCRRSRLLKQLLTLHDGHWLTTIAHHEHFILRWAKKRLFWSYNVPYDVPTKTLISLYISVVWSDSVPWALCDSEGWKVLRGGYWRLIRSPWMTLLIWVFLECKYLCVVWKIFHHNTREKKYSALFFLSWAMSFQWLYKMVPTLFEAVSALVGKDSLKSWYKFN